jgi:hypothetical protein
MLSPAIEPASQRMDAGDSLFSQLLRHTGASGFVGSSTVEDYLAIPRNLSGALI